MKSCFLISIGAVVIFIASAATSSAASTFSFVYDQSNYVTSPGGHVAVNLYLQQSGLASSGQTNVLGGPGAVGVTGTGVVITFPTGPNDAQVLSTANITGNSSFDNFGFGPFTSVSSGTALLSQATSGTPLLGTTVAPNTFDLLLGTFVFTAGTVSPHVTTISAAIPLVPHSNDNVAATSPLPTVLSSISSGSATITVVSASGAVPEPSALGQGLTALMILGGLYCLRKALPVLVSVR
jgi:hypothetical protein